MGAEYAIDAAPSRRTKVLTLGTMCIAMFMTMLDSTIVNVALPSIQEGLGGGMSGLEWVMNSYTLLFGCLILTGGTLGDLFGRRRLFAIGLILFTSGSLLCGLAPSLGVLIAARAIQGVGAAALVPSTLAILTNTYHDPRERAHAIGIWAGVSGMALSAGPLLGGLLVERFGWGSIFLVNVPVGALALVACYLAVRESRHPEGRSVDVGGQLLAVVSLASVTYALIEANSYGWDSPLIIVMFALAAVSGVAFVAVEWRASSPALQLRLFRNSTFAVAIACAAAINFAVFGVFFFFSLFFQDVQGLSALQAGVRYLPCTLPALVVAPLAGRIAARVGSRPPMSVGLGLLAVSLFLCVTVDAGTSYGQIWPMVLMIGVGMSLVMTPMTAAVMNAVPRQRAGMASATTNASRQVGGVFGIALLGAIVTHVFSDRLRDALTSLGMPSRVVDRAVEQAGDGVSQASGQAAAGSVDLSALHSAYCSAYVSGMHVALVIAGVVMAIVAVLVVLLVRDHPDRVEAG